MKGRPHGSMEMTPRHRIQVSEDLKDLETYLISLKI